MDTVGAVTTIFATSNAAIFIVLQLVAGQIIKKIIPLFLTVQLMYIVLTVYNSPANTVVVFSELDDALQLGMLKRLIFDHLE
jgi:hypothetical protein